MKMYPRMPVAYIAGPYRSPTAEGLAINIATAKKVGQLVALKGWSPMIPHANTAHLELPELGDEYWLAATLELMRRCDVVVLCPGWARSSGTINEIDVANLLGMPVFFAESQLPEAAKYDGPTAANQNMPQLLPVTANEG